MKKKDPPKKAGKWTPEEVAAAYERMAVNEMEIARGSVALGGLLEGVDEITTDLVLEELYPGVTPLPSLDVPTPSTSSLGVSGAGGKKNAKQQPQEVVEPPPKIPELGPNGKRVVTMVKVGIGLNLRKEVNERAYLKQEGVFHNAKLAARKGGDRERRWYKE
ncbi:hypothetical protein HDU93_006218, partial [Gonapodya sp. JEL0774]